MSKVIKAGTLGGMTRTAVLTSLLISSACSTESTDNSSPTPITTSPTAGAEIDDEALSTEPDNNPVTRVMLESRVRLWTDESQRITIDYELHNNSDAEIIVLGSTHTLQIDRKADGTVRVLKGKQDTHNANFESPPTIRGQSLMPADSLTGSGSRLLPLRIDYPTDFDSTVDPSLDSVEFCIGYAIADELLPTRRDDGLYSLNEDLELQKFSCMNLQKQSDQATNSESVLDDEHWRNTLDKSLGLVNDQAINKVMQAMGYLQLPEDDMGGVETIEFSLEDGGGGTLQRVLCNDGGHFDVTSSSSATAQVQINASNCLIGSTSIDGTVLRSTYINEFGNESIIQIMRDVYVQDTTKLIHVPTGVSESDDGYPMRTTTLTDLTYSIEDNNETQMMTDVDIHITDFSGTAPDRSVSGSLTVAAPWTLDDQLQVDITVLRGLPVGSTPEFTSGQLELITGTGDRMLFDANSGLDETDAALITLERNGSVTTHFVPWAELF